MDNKPSSSYKETPPESTAPQEQAAVKPASPKRVWSWGDLLNITIVTILGIISGTVLTLFLLPSGVVDPSHPDKVANTASFAICELVIEFLVLGGSIYILGYQRKKLVWETFGFRSIRNVWIIVALLLGVVGSLVDQATGYLLPAPADVANYGLFSTGFTWVNITLFVLLGGIAIPAVEEWFFRGVLYRFMRERWGVWYGALLNAFVTALITFNLAAGIVSFVLALLAIFVFERSRSLWGAIIVRCSANLISLIVFYALSTPGLKIPLF